MIKRFIKGNRIITVVFVFAIFVVFAYMFSLDAKEWFKHAGDWFGVLFQLAIGYIINFMFYVTQVFIPNHKRNEMVEKCIRNRIEQIIKDMRDLIDKLSQIYLPDHKVGEYTKKDLALLLKKLDFADEVKVAKISSMPNQMKYFTVKEWMYKIIKDVEMEIDQLYKYYAVDISPNLMDVLEKILKSNNHVHMPLFMESRVGVTFNSCDDIFMYPYYELICELEQIKNSEYDRK